MRTWVRARVKALCGSCRGEVAKGSVLLEIRIAGTEGKRYRCSQCARQMFGDPAPDFVESDSVAPQPALPVEGQATATQDFVSIGHAGRASKVRKVVAMATRDFRRLQAGEED